MATQKARAKAAPRFSVTLKLPSSVPLAVHVHNLPRCRGDVHHSSCARLKEMLSCNQATIFGRKIAVCTHVK